MTYWPLSISHQLWTLCCSRSVVGKQKPTWFCNICWQSWDAPIAMAPYHVFLCCPCWHFMSSIFLTILYCHFTTMVSLIPWNWGYHPFLICNSLCLSCSKTMILCSSLFTQIFGPGWCNAKTMAASAPLLSEMSPMNMTPLYVSLIDFTAGQDT